MVTGITPWRYAYDAGPQPVALIAAPVAVGNCRLLVQRYLAAARDILLAPEDVVNPRLFRSTGEFVRRGRPMSLDGLPDGSVVFAERRVNGAGDLVDNGPEQYGTESGWAWQLHTAVLLGDFDPGASWLDDDVPTEGVRPGEPAVLHSTGFRDTVVVWGREKFLEHYLPVAAKVITEAPKSDPPTVGIGTTERPRPATTFDTMAIHRLSADLTEWLLAAGIEQWGRDDVQPWRVADQIDDGEWWVVDGPNRVEAAVRVIDHDPAIWPDGDADGHCYIHGLMVDRRAAGCGIGVALLRWAAEEAVRRGASALRLDCVEANTRLNDYYRAQGFLVHGRRSLPAPWHPVTLWERSLR